MDFQSFKVLKMVLVFWPIYQPVGLKWLKYKNTEHRGYDISHKRSLNLWSSVECCQQLVGITPEII